MQWKFHAKEVATLPEAVISLGSNLGDKINSIKTAIRAINLLPETKITDISNFYETEPFGVTEKQNTYVNCCAKVVTEFEPSVLLGTLLGIEVAMGRERPCRFCSRIIDLDLIFYENKILNEKNLILPHPRAFERAFVLVPLHDICQSGEFSGINFRESYEKCDRKKIILIK